MGLPFFQKFGYLLSMVFQLITIHHQLEAPMTHKIHEVYQKFLADLLTKWQRRQSRALSPDLLDAALMLLRLNLDSLEELLDALYSDHPRGRPPFDSIAMLRALLLMTLLRQKRI